MPDPEIGDRVLVTVFTGFDHPLDHLNTLTAHPAVPATVVFRGNTNGWHKEPLFTVRLEADAAPGWRKGDSYRTTVEYLREAR